MINRFFFPDESATSQIMTDAALHLAGCGHEVIVITGRWSAGSPGALPARDHVGGVTVRRIWSVGEGGGAILRKALAFASFYPGALLALVRILRRSDVVVAKTDPPLIGFVAFLAAKLRGALLVNWLQDLYPEVAVRLKPTTVPKGIRRVLTALRNRSLRSARFNVVIGHLMAEEIRRQGVPEERLRVIPNWADEDAIRPMAPAQSQLRERWGLSPSTFVLGYSGKLRRAHEAATIAEAATRLRDREDIRFLFIGGGDESRWLEKVVAERGLTNCLFRPHQPREALVDSLAAPDAHWLSLRPELEGLIVPSKFYGIAAAGRPVLAVTAVDGEIARIVQEEGCGLAVAPGDVEGLVNAITLLAGDAELRIRMGARARALAEGPFSRSEALGRWSSVLSERELLA
jgi:glycosyltransferase involved in cell wall biosynthesis